MQLIADLNSPKQELKVRVECTDQPGAYRFAQSLQVRLDSSAKPGRESDGSPGTTVSGPASSFSSCMIRVSSQTTPLLGELRLVTFVEDALTPLHLLPGTCNARTGGGGF